MTTESISFPALKARFNAVGCALFEQQGDKGPDRFYVGRGDLIIGVRMTLEALADFAADLEGDQREADAKASQLEAEDEPAFRTWTERREQIVSDNDADRAIGEVLGTLHAIHGQAHLLCQDTVRDKDAWVLSIAHAIMELADASRDFLDRPGGWSAATPESSERITHLIMDEIGDMTATVEKFDLHEQEGAARQLPVILNKVRELSGALNDLCNCEHLPRKRLASEGIPT
jgi:hypothetical protein